MFATYTSDWLRAPFKHGTRRRRRRRRRLRLKVKPSASSECKKSLNLKSIYLSHSLAWPKRVSLNKQQANEARARKRNWPCERSQRVLNEPSTTTTTTNTQAKNYRLYALHKGAASFFFFFFFNMRLLMRFLCVR